MAERMVGEPNAEQLIASEEREENGKVLRKWYKMSV